LPAYSTAGNVNRLAGGYQIAVFLCPSNSQIQSSSTIDNLPGGALAYTTHYYGNAGPKGTNPTTGQPYNVSAVSNQGGLACDGILPYHPTLTTTNPTPPGAVKIADITDGTSNTLLLFEMAWNGLELAPGSFRAWPRGPNFTSDSNASK